jgi:mycothiol system anti-sigma-R factor
MNCGDCKEKLDRYLDRELSDGEVTELKLHLDDCPPCADQYEFQAQLKRLVKVCCNRTRSRRRSGRGSARSSPSPASGAPLDAPAIPERVLQAPGVKLWDVRLHPE